MFPVIIFEGLNGVGKSTVAKHVEAQAREMGIDVRRFYDPGSTPLGKAIRAIVKDPEIPATPREQLLLYTIARGSLAREIKAAQEEGALCILDRWLSSTIAYQGRATPLEEILQLHRKYVDLVTLPEFTFYLRAPEEVLKQRLGRASGQDFTVDRFEAEGDAGRESIRQGYEMQVERSWMTPIDLDADHVEVNLGKVWRHLHPLLRRIQITTDACEAVTETLSNPHTTLDHLTL